MKNDDMKRIPATRVTLSAPAVRNTTVVRISAQRKNTAGRKQYAPAAGRYEEARERFPKEPDFYESQGKRTRETGDIWAAMDSRAKKSDDFSGAPNNRPEKDGDIWAAMDDRPITSNDFAATSSRRPKRSDGFFTVEDNGFAQTDEIEFPERKRGYSGSYRKTANVRAGTETPFGSFVVEVLFTVLLLSAVCALLTVRLGGESPFSFFYPGNSLWACICLSVAAFALLRIFFRVPYFVGVFAAFGTLFAVNMGWLTGLARLFLSENTAFIGGLALYLILLAGFLMLLWLLYRKRFKLDLAVKILGGALAILVLVNLVINWPM